MAVYRPKLRENSARIKALAPARVSRKRGGAIFQGRGPRCLSVLASPDNFRLVFTRCIDSVFERDAFSWENIFPDDSDACATHSRNVFVCGRVVSLDAIREREREKKVFRAPQFHPRFDTTPEAPEGPSILNEPVRRETASGRKLASRGLVERAKREHEKREGSKKIPGWKRTRRGQR